MSQELPDGVELPPLPKLLISENATLTIGPFTDDQMHEYATAAILADREKQAARVPEGYALLMAAGIASQYGVLEEHAFACAERILSLAAPTTEPSKAEQADAPFKNCDRCDTPGACREHEGRYCTSKPPASNAGERPVLAYLLTNEDIGYWKVFRERQAACGAMDEMERSGFLDNSLMPLVAALATKPQAGQKPVAYLDIGAGGYVDLGSDLTPEQLQALPFGRHALAIVGTFGIDGYVVAQAGDVAQDKIDAENYRWLCSHMIVPAPSLWDNGVAFATQAFPRKSGAMTKAELDAAIRAARTRGEGSV